MDRDGDGEDYEEKAQCPMIGDKDGTVEECQPYHADGQDLDSHRDSLVKHEVPDVRPEVRMLQQPVIKSAMASIEEGRGEEKKRCGRKYRQEYTKYTQS